MLMTLAGLVALASAEVALQLFGFAPPPGLFTVTEREFQRVPGIFQPNQQVLQQQGTDFAHLATIDSLGFRGTSFPREKPPEELRVLFVGDSFTWGHNVDDNETLPAQLQDRLVESCGPARVINAGLSGSTILGQGAMVERGLTVDPDVVILMFHENDIDELVSSRIWDQLAANRRVKSGFPLGLVYPVVRESAILNLAQNARRARRARAQAPAPQGARVVEPGTEQRVEEARGEYQDRLVSLMRLLGDREIAFIFVAFPHPASVSSREGGPHYSWALQVAAGLGLPTVDLMEPLIQSGDPVEDMFLLPLDYHPTARGHAIAANRLFRTLSEVEKLSCEGFPSPS